MTVQNPRVRGLCGGITALVFLAGCAGGSAGAHRPAHAALINLAHRAGLSRSSGDEEDLEVINRVTGCGVERWAIKTGIDRDAHLVNLKTSTPTTIVHLRSLAAPANPPLTQRVRPTETTDFTVTVILLRFKMEADSDFHLVLSDTGGRTMIAEIPAPQCVGSSSPFLAKIRYTRSVFTSRFHPDAFWRYGHWLVQVTGVAFFDFLHGQSGVAPNGIELHPVLNIRFGSGSGPPPAAPTPKASGTVHVTAGVSNANPAHYADETVYGRITAGGKGVAGVPMTVIWHYSTTTPSCSGVSTGGGTASCTRNIGRARSGYRVVIDVSFSYGGRSYTAETGFTPQ